jgi:hypothetical protein
MTRPGRPASLVMTDFGTGRIRHWQPPIRGTAPGAPNAKVRERARLVLLSR